MSEVCVMRLTRPGVYGLLDKTDMIFDSGKAEKRDLTGLQHCFVAGGFPHLWLDLLERRCLFRQREVDASRVATALRISIGSFTPTSIPHPMILTPPISVTAPVSLYMRDSDYSCSTNHMRRKPFV